MKHEIDNEKHKLASEFGEKEFWDKVKYLLNHQEISRLLNLFRSQYRWANLIETVITIIVAIFLITILICLVNNNLIDKGSFGVMFGTVFGYLLSWRFGK
jgi:hypothetical protein